MSNGNPASAGERYIVRNSDWQEGKIWGVDMAHADAIRRKELVAGRRLSRTVIVEPMPANPELAKACREICVHLDGHGTVVDPQRYVLLNMSRDLVWGIDLTMHDAKLLKEKVAGRRLSRSMAIEPMPTDAAQIEMLKMLLVAPEVLSPPMGVQPRVTAGPTQPVVAPGIVVVPVPGTDVLLQKPTDPALSRLRSAAVGAAAAAAAEANARVKEKAAVAADQIDHAAARAKLREITAAESPEQDEDFSDVDEEDVNESLEVSIDELLAAAAKG
jgi:hypothetical protein